MPGLKPTQQDIDQFVAITQASPEDAEHFLSAGTTLQGAIEDFFAAQGATDPAASTAEDQEALLDQPTMSQPGGEEPAQNPGGPRTLGGNAVDTSLPEGWGKSQKKLGRIGDWGGGAGPSSGARPPAFDDDDEEDEDEDDKRGQEFFTGGEKSGLAVENPDKKGKSHRGIVSDILKQAAEGSKSGEEREADKKPSSSFRGAGHTLGSDDTPSAQVRNDGSSGQGPSSRPSAGALDVNTTSSSSMNSLLASILGGRQAPPPPEEDEEPQSRSLTFWRDGFSIEDGPLFRYDDPKNQDLLEAIKSGRAPPSLFGVRYNQPLQIQVAQRTNEDYQPPPKVTKPFEGSGNRLGSAAPEVTGSGSTTPSMPGGMAQPSAGSSSAAPSSQPTAFELDSSKPFTSIQLRLGDGTRLVAKVNLTHTVGDLRGYVAAARPDARPFVLQTTFPSKELSDPSETVEAARLQNAVVVQRFT